MFRKLTGLFAVIFVLACMAAAPTFWEAHKSGVSVYRLDLAGVAPTATQMSNNAVKVGDMIVDTSTDAMYIMIDSTAGAPQFLKTTTSGIVGAAGSGGTVTHGTNVAGVYTGGTLTGATNANSVFSGTISGLALVTNIGPSVTGGTFTGPTNVNPITSGGTTAGGTATSATNVTPIITGGTATGMTSSVPVNVAGTYAGGAFASPTNSGTPVFTTTFKSTAAPQAVGTVAALVTNAPAGTTADAYWFKITYGTTNAVIPMFIIP